MRPLPGYTRDYVWVSSEGRRANDMPHSRLRERNNSHMTSLARDVQDKERRWERFKSIERHTVERKQTQASDFMSFTRRAQTSYVIFCAMIHNNPSGAEHRIDGAESIFVFSPANAKTKVIDERFPRNRRRQM
ncbi:hypothetical protein KIN20_029897 [Parelaphostrongylus tenuis]|uniref:Uncharacterized protein n=1 Tax=Parelaphostrongylus tenuis TaxID=148309 RepID=A0AAD5WG02_PARTN|nr:hypothetical protein KIN20_029897 [Parelaphostrongylus tenuis]